MVESLVLRYNRIAMDFLKELDFKRALTLLKKTEEKLKSEEVPATHTLWGVTLNNLGCYFQKTGKPIVALHYLERAVSTSLDIQNLLGIYLNISSLKSRLGDHGSAIKYSQRALKSAKTQLESNPSVALYAVAAYKALGGEMELAHNLEEALKLYREALTLANSYLGEHPLTKEIEENVFRCTQHEKARNLSENSSYRSKNSRSEFSSRFSSLEKPLRNEVKRPLELTHRAKPTRKKVKQRTRMRKVQYYINNIPKINVFNRSVSIQVQKKTPNEAAIVIQRAWKLYKFKEKNEIARYEKEIAEAKKAAQKALFEYEMIKESRNKAIKQLRHSEGQIPVPRKYKTTELGLKIVRNNDKKMIARLICAWFKTQLAKKHVDFLFYNI